MSAASGCSFTAAIPSSHLSRRRALPATSAVNDDDGPPPLTIDSSDDDSDGDSDDDCDSTASPLASPSSLPHPALRPGWFAGILYPASSTASPLPACFDRLTPVPPPPPAFGSLVSLLPRPPTPLCHWNFWPLHPPHQHLPLCPASTIPSRSVRLLPRLCFPFPRDFLLPSAVLRRLSLPPPSQLPARIPLFYSRPPIGAHPSMWPCRTGTGSLLTLARPRRSLPPPTSRPSLPFDFGFGTTAGGSSTAGSIFFVRSSTLHLVRLFPGPTSLHSPLPSWPAHPGLSSSAGLLGPVSLPCNGPPNLICPHAPLLASSPNSLAALVLLSAVSGSSSPSPFSPTSTSSISVDSFLHQLQFPQPLSVAILEVRDAFLSSMSAR